MPLATLGMMWFLAAQVLTATVVPLELVFEHRNYFASLGLCLVAVEPLLALSRWRWRWPAAIVALAVALTLAALTGLRAREWADPVSFAVSEARKQPDSPRASYYYGWVLATASEHKPDSPLVDQAFAALEHSAALPAATVLSGAGRARTGRAYRPPGLTPSLAAPAAQRLRERPIGPQETGALAGLVGCALQGLCAFPPDQMLETFAAAMSHGDHPELFNSYANYALNVLHDPDLALRAWQEARRFNPAEPQYRIAIAKLLIALNRGEEARGEIASLRGLGRLGQYQREAQELEQRLQNHAR